MNQIYDKFHDFKDRLIGKFIDECQNLRREYYEDIERHKMDYQKKNERYHSKIEKLLQLNDETENNNEDLLNVSFNKLSADY